MDPVEFGTAMVDANAPRGEGEADGAWLGPGERARASAWVLDALRTAAGEQYFGEPVTLLEHALQTAAHAVLDGASDPLVLAALLTDIGHVLHPAWRGASSSPVLEVRHEVIGARALARHYGRAVTEPIRLHVAAKRYLCATNLAYARTLSRGARLGLERRGGPMTPPEIRVFEQTPWAREAVRLRRWDDAAGRPSPPAPRLERYHDIIERLVGRW
ncbi:MAG: HD domain-containing protein [Vicinamibacterales bacterium]